ncbi:MAG: hypothetical protein P1V35_05150, partial [Planctomycetota bacterium]|nr:hypothetical protein [Planctomycetota bacterium]
IGIASHRDGGGPFIGLDRGNALAIWTFRDGASDDTNVAGAIVVETISSASGSQYCAVPDNSSGTSGWIRARTGSWNPGTSLTLYASDLPVNVFAHFIVSNQPGLVLFPGGSQGHLCLQGAIGRYNGANEIRHSGSSGSLSLLTESDAIPTPNGTVAAMSGETWNFQCWYRDNGPNSNFTNAVSVTFD